MFNVGSIRPSNDDEREFIEERAAICEYDGKQKRKEAESEAWLCLLSYKRREAKR